MSDPAFQQMLEEEDLRTEASSPVKREYVAGFVYPLRGAALAQAGATSRHGELCINLILALAPTTRQQGCAIYQSDMRVSVRSPTGKASYYYPDIVVTCEPLDDDATITTSPCLIAEVLSPGKRHSDLTDKLWAYTSLSSLQTYLITEAQGRLVRVVQRRSEGWSEHDLEGSGAVRLPCPDLSLTLDQIYGLDPSA